MPTIGNAPLGEDSSIDGSEKIPVSGSKWMSLANLAIYVWNYLTSLTAKTTLVDADQLALADSSASNVAKKITWANIMTQILAYAGTVTQKVFNLGSNTLTGTAAEFDTAISDDNMMTLGRNQTVTGVKTFGSAGGVGKLAVAGNTSGSTVLNAAATASGTLTLPAATDTLVARDTTDTLTNKRVSPRVVAVTVSATPTINTDNGDIFTITSQNAAITSMTTNLSGTPTSGQKMLVEILDNGSARAITWGASYASGPATLPTTTIVSKWLYVGLEWSASRSKWICMATGSEA